MRHGYLASQWRSVNGTLSLVCKIGEETGHGCRDDGEWSRDSQYLYGGAESKM